MFAIIEDNDKTAPTKFEDYPTILDDIIDGIKGAMIIMDTIKLNANTTLAQLNALFSYLPEANSYTASTRVATIDMIVVFFVFIIAVIPNPVV